MPHHSLVGQKLSNGKYEVTDFIGPGGMSEVFKGVDTQLKRRVAIKVLEYDLVANPYFTRRFKEEVETAANLEHPNIVKIYDIQQHDNLHYCVMQYLPQGLSSILKKDKILPAVEAIRILTPIAEALAFVHRNGIVHRDLKPGNIMFDEHHTPILTDFGIAVRDDSTRFQGPVATGTPEYMSPEQIRGGEIDFRSDIYSLGIVLYELLTGNVPFHSEDPLAVLYQQVNEPLPEKPLQDNQVPKRVREILVRCLAKSPEERYQSTEALVDAFRGILRDPPTPRPVSRQRGIPKVVVGASLLVVGAAVAFLLLRKPSPAGPVYATFTVVVLDSLERAPVPFAGGELKLSLPGLETTLAFFDTDRVSVRFCSDSAEVQAPGLSGDTYNLYYPLERSLATLRVSALMPYYEVVSDTFSIRPEEPALKTLNTAPIDQRCTKCGRPLQFGDEFCSWDGTPRTMR